MMEYDLHTLLDALTLVATVAIIYCMTCTNMKVTYQREQDTVKSYFVVSGQPDLSGGQGPEQGPGVEGGAPPSGLREDVPVCIKMPARWSPPSPPEACAVLCLVLRRCREWVFKGAPFVSRPQEATQPTAHSLDLGQPAGTFQNDSRAVITQSLVCRCTYMYIHQHSECCMTTVNTCVSSGGQAPALRYQTNIALQHEPQATPCSSWANALLSNN